MCHDGNGYKRFLLLRKRKTFCIHPGDSTASIWPPWTMNHNTRKQIPQRFSLLCLFVPFHSTLQFLFFVFYFLHNRKQVKKFPLLWIYPHPFLYKLFSRGGTFHCLLEGVRREEPLTNNKQHSHYPKHFSISKSQFSH